MNTTDTEGLPADTSNEEPSNTPKTYPSISQDPLAHEFVVLKDEHSKLREQYVNTLNILFIIPSHCVFVFRLKNDKLQLINRKIMAIENGEDTIITTQIQSLEANKEKQLKILEQRLCLQKQAIEAKYDAECYEINNELAV